MKVQRHTHKRRESLLTEECSLAFGNTSSLERRMGDKVAGDGYLGLDESMDITTVNEQGVQWDFTNVEMRNQAFRKIVAEKLSCSWERVRVPIGGRNRTRAGVA